MESFNTCSRSSSFLIVLCLSLFISQVYSVKNWGLCPDVETNHKYGTFNTTKMSGIWYEYLATEDLKEGKDYDCASWLLI